MDHHVALLLVMTKGEKVPRNDEMREFPVMTLKKTPRNDEK